MTNDDTQHQTTTSPEPKPIILSAGVHDTPEQGTCAIEAVRVSRGLPFSDRTPDGDSPVLCAFIRGLNDALGHWDERMGTHELQRLVAYLPRIDGTTRGTPEQERERSLLTLDWLFRTYLPAWLRLVPSLASDADTLAALPDLTTPGTDYAAIGVVVRAAEAAASAAAWDAASAAASAAAWAAATWTAWDAAWAAAWDAAIDAAVQRLAPTVAALQTSAFGLLDAMLAVPTQQIEEVRE